MNSLIKTKTIKSSKILFDFLTLEDLKIFSKTKSDYSKQPVPTLLTDFSNNEGVIQIKINTDELIKSKLISKSMSSYEIILKKLNTNLQSLMSDLENVQGRMKEISNNFNQLHQCTEMFDFNKNITNSYKILTELTKNWSASYTKQIKVIDVEIREFFDYTRKEVSTFGELINNYEVSKNEYNYFETKLHNKKEELFNSANLLKWDIPAEDMEMINKVEILKNKEEAFSIMLPKERIYSLTLKRNLGYHLTALWREYDRMQKSHSKNFKKHFLSLSEKNTDLLADIFSIVKLLTFSY